MKYLVKSKRVYKEFDRWTWKVKANKSVIIPIEYFNTKSEAKKDMESNLIYDNQVLYYVDPV